MQLTTSTISSTFFSACRRACRTRSAMCLVTMFICLSACEREPDLHLHQGTEIEMQLPVVDLSLNALWDYLFKYDEEYDWQAEWLYGWDDTDLAQFGKIGYEEPTEFEIRRYFTQQTLLGQHNAPYSHHIEGNLLSAKYDFGFWDILAWNDIKTSDGVQSIHIDEQSTYDFVTAFTGQTMYPSKYNAPKYNHSFYQPEELFAGYDSGIDINRSLEGFTFDAERNCWVRRLDMDLQPVTYIYLVQVILHNNYRDFRKVTATDGTANLSGMARSVKLNTGVTGTDAVTVSFNTRMKFDVNGKNGEKVDIIGGKLMTFGMPNLNPHKLSTRAYKESLSKIAETDLNNRHYIDVNMQFYNGKDSTLVFDVTDQVRRLFRGGVITIDVDMDHVPTPNRKGGSGFDAVVKDYDEEEWEFDM